MTMNFPFNKAFCTYLGFCLLLFPLFKGKWLALRIADKKDARYALDWNNRPVKKGWKIVILDNAKYWWSKSK
jgi:hypothetical protein